MCNPHVDSRQLRLPTLARFSAPRINISKCLLVACGLHSLMGWMWHRKSNFKKIKPAPVELGNCPSQWVLSGLVQRAHARLAADPPFEIE